MSKKLDLKAIPERIGSRYPKPFDAPCQTRRALSLTEAAGLSLIGPANAIGIEKKTNLSTCSKAR